jgi:hypothetical protein
MPSGLGLFCLGLSACLAASGCLGRQPGVVCSVGYGGEVRRLTFPATESPYNVKAVDVAGRFAFKAIYVREPWRAASISVYAYQRTNGEDRLLQEAVYAPPFAGHDGFTGRQLVYSTEQRELEYSCQLSR